MDAMTIKTNNKPRALVSLAQLPDGVHAEWFDYVDAAELAGTGEDHSPRFFCYRGSWYDSAEFELAPADIRRHGFDGVQTESYFSAVLLRYFDREGNLIDDGDSVVVGYAHW